MRHAPHIMPLWQQGGPFIGAQGAPHHRVTVEPDWYLNSTSAVSTMDPSTLPYRWYQRQDNSQTEIEIPNVRHIHTEISSDSDAGSCTITLLNTRMDPNLTGQNRKLGDPGWMNPHRSGMMANARWGIKDQTWAGILEPGVLIRCVDTETEVLARHGWLRWDELNVGDEILGINPDTGQSEWQPVAEVFSAPYSGELVSMRTRSHDSLTTSNHRWLVSNRAGHLSWRTTDTMSTRSRIPMAAPHFNTNVPVYSDDFVELAAWYYTEGSAEHRLRSMDWGGSISQSEGANPDNVVRIRRLFHRLYGEPGLLPRGTYVPQERMEEAIRLRRTGMTCAKVAEKVGVSAESVRRWGLGRRTAPKNAKWMERPDGRGTQLFTFTQEVALSIRTVICGPDKVPAYTFLSALTQAQLERFIEVCVLGDGTVDRGQRVFLQGHEGRMDAFVYACVLAGIPVRTSRRSEGGWKTVLLGCETVAPVSAARQAKGRTAITRRRHGAVEPVQYKGIVWCPRVPHGNWLARRNGTVYFTGNTYQGYGGLTKSISQALADGNLMQTGTWIVDDVPRSAGGVMNLVCRNMAALVIDQQLYPPLIPYAKYPLQWCRHRYTTVRTPAVPVYDSTSPPAEYGPEGWVKTVRDGVLTPDGTGYWILGNDGGIFAYGSAPFYGSLGTSVDPAESYGIESTSSGRGYWIVNTAGQVYAFGDAQYYGGLGPAPPNPIRRIRSTPSGAGYWLLDNDGGVYAFGDAQYYGGTPVATPAHVDMQPTPSGAGYWLLAADGSVYAFGDAQYYGGGNATGKVFVGMTPRADGSGYWLAASDGNVYGYGNAVPLTPNGNWTTEKASLQDPIVAISGTDTGYILVGGDGGVFSFGSIGFYGSLPARFQTTVRTDGTYKDFCVDEATEAFTRRGWLSHKELREGDEVLGIDDETGEARWHRVNGVYRRWRKRSMVRMKGASFDSLTTPDHKWLVRSGGVSSTQYGRRDRDGSRLKWTTSDAMNTNDSILLAVPAVTAGEATYDDAFVELVAWFWTEGHWSASGAGLSQSAVKNPSCVARIDTCLTTLYGEADKRGPGQPPAEVAAQARWSRTTRASSGVVLYNLSKVAAEALHQVCDPLTKAVSPEFLLALTKPQLDVFIAVSMLADATCNKERRGKMLHRHSASEKAETMTQMNEERIKSFEFACVLAGQAIVTHLRHVTYKGERRPVWATTLLKTPEVNIVRSASTAGRAKVVREDYEGVVWCPQTELGNWVCRHAGQRDGGGMTYSTHLTGNSDIVKMLLLWSGFLLYGTGEDTVYGNIESTGTYSNDCLPPDMFDKKNVIDAITVVKEAVGYLFWVDEEGAARFESPNWFVPGNFYETGEHTQFIPEIDERQNLFTYSLTDSNKVARSELIISSNDPLAGFESTVTTRYVPPFADRLHGQIKPAMWVNEYLTSAQEQELMAELIAIQMFFQQRQSQAQAAANPALQINDQVWVFEEETGEAAIKYIRGISTDADLESGEYTMNLTFSHLGRFPNDWALQ